MSRHMRVYFSLSTASIAEIPAFHQFCGRSVRQQGFDRDLAYGGHQR